MSERTAERTTRCPCCGTPLVLRVTDGPTKVTAAIMTPDVAARTPATPGATDA